MPPKRKRRQWGTGSIYRRRSDGRWLGKLQAGWTPAGTRRAITVSATTQAEAKRRLEELKRQIARDGLPETGTSQASRDRTDESLALTVLVRAGMVAGMQEKPIKRQLVETLYPGDLDQDVKAMLELGLSWRRIADHINEKAKVRVSHETVRTWYAPKQTAKKDNPEEGSA